MKPYYVCPDCGGTLLGDGFTTVVHCERVDISVDTPEPDALPRYCGAMQCLNCGEEYQRGDEHRCPEWAVAANAATSSAIWDAIRTHEAK